jgi:hypothetical protein
LGDKIHNKQIGSVWQRLGGDTVRRTWSEYADIALADHHDEWQRSYLDIELSRAMSLYLDDKKLTPDRVTKNALEDVLEEMFEAGARFAEARMNEGISSDEAADIVDGSAGRKKRVEVVLELYDDGDGDSDPSSICTGAYSEYDTVISPRTIRRILSEKFPQRF